MSTASPVVARDTAIDTIWYTRCPVPTASGIAFRNGWLAEEFAADGIAVRSFQEDAKGEDYSRHHYDHELPGLFREGGNMLAIAAQAQGAPNKLIGLTFIDEGQAIVVRPDSGISAPEHLKGKRIALPAYSELPIRRSTRGSSIGRGMTLAGVKGALASAGLGLDDVRFVELPYEERAIRFARSRDPGEQAAGSRRWWGLQHLAEGKVDAVYVKGAAAADAVRELGLAVGIDLDLLPDPRFRVNNGTPRPITVHADLIEHHFDLVVRFLQQTLRASDWAADNLEGVRAILEGETRGQRAGVLAAYRDGFHTSLHPTLDPQRLALFRRQKDFLWLHGFLDRDFDFDAWVDPRPLEEARRRHAQATRAA